MVDLTPHKEIASLTKPAKTVSAQLLRFLRARLKEASTIRGALLICTAMGVYVSPEKQEAIVALGLAIAGAVGVFFPDSE